MRIRALSREADVNYFFLSLFLAGLLAFFVDLAVRVDAVALLDLSVVTDLAAAFSVVARAFSS